MNNKDVFLRSNVHLKETNEFTALPKLVPELKRIKPTYIYTIVIKGDPMFDIYKNKKNQYFFKTRNKMPRQKRDGSIELAIYVSGKYCDPKNAAQGGLAYLENKKIYNLESLSANEIEKESLAIKSNVPLRLLENL